MTWFKVDDSFYDHPKVFDAPDCALALWMRAGCWSARNLTDGFVPAKLPARLCDDPDTAVKDLVDRGLWRRTKGGFQFHDWTDYQPSAERVKETRKKRAEAGSRGGKAKAAKQSASNLLDGSQGDAKQNPAPTRPDPTSPNGEGGSPADADGALFPPPEKPKKASRRKPETPLSDTFTVTDDMRAWAAEHAPGVDVDRATTKFRNHAEANDRRQRDWPAAWRNWLLNEKPTTGNAIARTSVTDQRVAGWIAMGAQAGGRS